MARPFLKWAGGKSQLLKRFESFYPPELARGEIKTYIEPFLGGGAVFFDICKKFAIEQAFLSDINQELILVYQVIQSHAEKLIERLAEIDQQFKHLSPERRKQYYYEIRESYNSTKKKIHFNQFADNWISRAAQIIFLNKTCFNGLFRENKKGQFNVPFGQYKNPKILDAVNIRAASRLLQKATISYACFETAEKYIGKSTFIYFDPPYRPISSTANFTTYFRSKFNETDQIRLNEFFKSLDANYPVKMMLSNSDPKNIDPNDQFFDKLYAPFYINRIKANRIINRDASKRGQLTELVITNYPVE